MSIVIAYAAPDKYNIMITDTRIYDDFRKNKYRDGNKKLYQLPNSIFMAGVGSGMVINNYYERLLNIQSTDKNMLYNAYKDTCKEFLIENQQESELLEYVKNTNVLISCANKDSCFIQFFNQAEGVTIDERGIVLLPDDVKYCDFYSKPFGIKENITEALKYCLHIFKRAYRSSNVLSDEVCLSIAKKGEYQLPLYYRKQIDNIICLLENEKYDEMQNKFIP